jgi:predicted NAD/FAD-binding protein
MPRSRRAWASWNYLERASKEATQATAPCVTYWMNRLQPLATKREVFVTLNPVEAPASTHYTTAYTHPLFDAAALVAQRDFWRLQGVRQTWFCGAHWGHGFHEDGLQSGLLVAERLGGMARPWPVPAQPSRVAPVPARWTMPAPEVADAA